MAVELRILGLLEAADAGERIELRSAKLRTLLAVLVLHANEVVSADALIEALWGDAPPESAANTLQGYVSQLRKSLGASTIQTRAPGYVLSVPPDAVDAVLFERLVKEGQGALASGNAAGAVLSAALGLWRGQALADFPSTPSPNSISPAWASCASSPRRTLSRPIWPSDATPTWSDACGRWLRSTHCASGCGSRWPCTAQDGALQPPIWDIGRAGRGKPGSSIPWLGIFCHTA